MFTVSQLSEFIRGVRVIGKMGFIEISRFDKPRGGGIHPRDVDMLDDFLACHASSISPPPRLVKTLRRLI